MSQEQSEYTTDWALKQYPDVCRTCRLVTGAVAELLPLIEKDGQTAEDRELTVWALKSHAQHIVRDCIKAYLDTQFDDINEAWPEGQECWTEGHEL